MTKSYYAGNYSLDAAFRGKRMYLNSEELIEAEQERAQRATTSATRLAQNQINALYRAH